LIAFSFVWILQSHYQQEYHLGVSKNLHQKKATLPGTYGGFESLPRYVFHYFLLQTTILYDLVCSLVAGLRRQANQVTAVFVEPGPERQPRTSAEHHAGFGRRANDARLARIGSPHASTEHKNLARPAHRTGNASSEVYSVRLKLGRYEVGNLGLAYCAELSDGLLNDPIRVRHALMLPEMLKPGR
jgi:hypothetical protein